LPLGLLSSLLLPLVAFHAGHPERVRYMVAVVVAMAAIAGLGLAAVPRILRPVAVIGVLILSAVSRPPLWTQDPMVLEAQWERPFHDARRVVTSYLVTNYTGDSPIMASMGSLAHYMQETSLAGLPLRSFLHEGNGDLWTAALASPSHYVGWMLVEERALGGDMLAKRAQQDPSFLDGFHQVSAGGGLVLYRRMP
jgi:hypothetical protein